MRFPRSREATLLLLQAVFTLPAAASSQRIPDFRLLDQKGIAHQLYRFGDRAAVVFILYKNGCGSLVRSLPKLASLERRFDREKVAFFFLDPYPDNSMDAHYDEIVRNGISIPILQDASQSVAMSLGASRCAEALVVNTKGWHLAYRGAVIDASGKRELLAAALKDLLAGKAPTPERTEVREDAIDFIGPRHVSYAGDIAPILRAKCANCHFDEKGPAPLTSYERVRAWSPMIREEVMTGRMPPWSADPKYGKFENDISLSTDEMKTLVTWIDAGSPQEGRIDPLADSPKVRPDDWPLGKPDFILAMSTPAVVPATGTLAWRYFELAGPLPEDIWLSAAHVLPGNLGVVHHVFVISLPAPFSTYWQDEYNLRAGDMMAIRPREASIFWNWTPGRLPMRLPDNVAIRLQKGHYVVLEVHYTPNGREETDRTQIGFYRYKGKSKPKAMRIVRLNKEDILIPPRKRDVAISPQFAFRFLEDAYLLNLRAHMHRRGTRIRAVARYPDGRKETLLSVTNYNFDWQHVYILKEPKLLPAGTMVFADGAYDNSRLNPVNPDPDKEVKFGLRTMDEMFFLYATYVNASD